MLLIGLSIFVVASAAYAFATSIDMLITLRHMQAIGGCSAGVVSRAIVHDLFERQQAARILAYSGALMNLAPAVVPPIGTYILVWVGWEENFFVVSLCGGALFVIVSLSLSESNTAPDPLALTPARMFVNIRLLLSHRVYTGHALTNSAVFSGLFVFISSSSFVLIDVMGIPPVEFSFYFALGIFGYILRTGVSGRVGDRVNVDKLIRDARWRYSP